MPGDDPTPIRKQYLDVKRQYPDTIVLFRLGDFYETFDADADLVARELDLVLTRRNIAKGRYVPMAGIPHHAAENYIARLIAKGYHVAICEQVSTQAINGLFHREVVRVVTPGTVVEPGMLDAARNNYLAALLLSAIGERAALAHVDITTGEFAVASLPANDGGAAVRQELLRLRPAELLVADGTPLPPLDGIACPRTSLAAWKFDPVQAHTRLLEHFQVASLAGFGLEQAPLLVGACGAILQYLQETQPPALNLLTSLSTYALDDYMALDAATRRNLELTETLRSGQVKGSLLGVLDHTVTAMGARLLRQWVNQPLLDRGRIEERLDRVAAFHADGLLRAEMRTALKPLSDLERITNRVVGGSAHPRDLIAMRATLADVPAIAALLPRAAPASAALSSLAAGLDPCAETLELLNTALAEEPPAVLSKPGVIRPGFSAELDGILAASRHAKDWIAGLEAVERERTGLKTLKVRYNKVFGYYIELSRGQSDNAPENYIRKQTLVNAERYITPELKEYETIVSNADERVRDIEARLFREMCAQIGQAAPRLLATARALAHLDVCASLAETASRGNYARPGFEADGVFDVRGGRHPVVEQFLPAGERFVPNDIVFEPGECVRIITGPNMSGKCVRADTLVFSDRGLVPVASLQPALMAADTFAPLTAQVKGMDGLAQATHFYYGGCQPTVRVRTRLGYELEGTPEHRVWVRHADGREGWKPLARLSLGDRVAIDRELEVWGSDTTLRAPRAASLTASRALKLYRLPAAMSEDLAYLMGLLVGDGTLPEKNYLALTSGDGSLAAAFVEVCQRLFGYSVEPRRKAGRLDCRVGSAQIRLFLKELGLEHITATGKQIPASVLRAPRPMVRAFLQGLFDTDGTAGKNGNVSLSTSSPELARQVQCLLLNFGIVSSRQAKQGARSAIPAFQVYLCGAEASRFYQQIGFRLARKQGRGALVSALRMPNTGGIPFLAPAPEPAEARIVATPAKPVALKRNQAIDSNDYTYPPGGRRRYFYEPIVQLERGQAEVYDLAVAGQHAFVANGFVNHNSTYLRESALIVLLAQMGSFVPAESACLGLVDRIFTRIGAQDEIHAGQSTFMVEMVETANILRHATPRSLLVLDEIGRGTSTYDGLSLAWAIVEHVHNHPRLRAKTLFATHYHELTDLAALLPGVRNYNVAVAEDANADRVIFLHRIVPGGADRSYGIHVAQLAGLPRPIINRAQEIMAQLQATSGRAVHLDEAPAQQMALFPETSPLLDELRALDVNTTTPVEALNKLFEWKARFAK